MNKSLIPDWLSSVTYTRTKQTKRGIYPLLCLASVIGLFQMTGCKTLPTLQGDALVDAKLSIRAGIKDVWDHRIDTSHVYTLRIIRCTECVNSLTMRRFKTQAACDGMPCIGMEEADSTDANRQNLAIVRPPKLESVTTHYLRFLDEKRVVYGVRKGEGLPGSLDLKDRFHKIAGGKKFARGYYYTTNGNLHIRFQDRRNHKVFDWVFNILENGMALKLNVITAYSAQETDVKSSGFAKHFKMDKMLSYNFIFNRQENLSIPVKPECRPCMGLPPKDCTTW